MIFLKAVGAFWLILTIVGLIATGAANLGVPDGSPFPTSKRTSYIMLAIGLTALSVVIGLAFTFAN